MDIPPSIATVVAIVAALGGISGIAALINGLTAARANDFNHLNAIVDQLQEENQRLIKRMDSVERENEWLRSRINELQRQNQWLMRENTILRDSLRAAGIEIPEFQVHDDEA